MSETNNTGNAVKIKSLDSGSSLLVEEKVHKEVFSENTNSLDDETVEQILEDRFVSGIVAPHARKPAVRKKKKKSTALKVLIVIFIAVVLFLACFIGSASYFGDNYDSTPPTQNNISAGGSVRIKNKPDDGKTESDIDTSDEATEKPAEKPKDTEAQKPAEKPKDTEAQKPAEKPKDTEAQKPAEKPKDTEAQKPAEKPKDTEAQKPAEKPKDTATEKPADTNEGIVLE